MKLIIAIISKDDRGDVTHELISAKYSVTKIPTTGGRCRGNWTTRCFYTMVTERNDAKEYMVFICYLR